MVTKKKKRKDEEFSYFVPWPKDKKGQMQMMETIGVIFIFFVLILFGSIFYFKFQEISFQNKQEELLAQRAMDTTLVALFMPEVQCSRGESEAEDNCVDLSKVIALQSVFEENPEYITDYYFNIFGYANVSVNMVYPQQHSWTIYNFEKMQTLENGTEVIGWERKEPTYFIVTLRNQVSTLDVFDSDIGYAFGYLSVEVYS